MPSLGLMELLVIGVVLLVVVGPERLPHATRWLGRTYGMLRRQAEELRRALVLEADRLDEEDRLKKLRERREEALSRAREQAEASAGEGTAAQPDPWQKVREAQEAEAAAAEASAESAIPGGFSEKEWEELPDHVKAIVRRRASS